MNAYSPNAEKQVAAAHVAQDLLGCCLLTPSAMTSAPAVQVHHFLDQIHRDIWSELRAAVETGEHLPVSVLASRLADNRQFNELGGIGWLADMVDKAPPVTVVPTLCDALISSWRSRRATEIAGQIAHDLTIGGPVEHVLAHYRSELEKLQAGAGRARFQPENFADVEPKPQPWLIKGALPVAGVGFIVGQSKAGKSFLALDTTLRLAAGAEKILTRKARQCGVVYIAAEDGEGCRYRIKAWHRKRHRENPMPFELIGRSVNLLDDGEVSELKAVLKASAQRFEAMGTRLGVVVFDTLSRCIPGADENSSTDMSRAFHTLEGIARDTGALALVVAHFGKSGSDRGIRGWSGLDANSDATITVERHAEDTDLRMVTLAKVKNGLDGGQLAFRLEDVPLGIFDDDGDEVSSCVPVFETASDPPAKQKRQRALTSPETLVLTAIRYVTEHGKTHPLPAAIEGKKAWQKAVTRADVRERANVAGLAADAKESAAKMRFFRALEGLIAAHKIRVEGDLLWLL